MRRTNKTPVKYIKAYHMFPKRAIFWTGRQLLPLTGFLLKSAAEFDKEGFDESLRHRSWNSQNGYCFF